MKIRLHLSLALAATLALGACNGSDSNGGEIPPEAAAGLQGALADLEGAVAAGSCTDARAAVELFNERLEAMGAVAEDVADRLGQGAGQLDTLVRREMCVPSEPTPPPAPPPATPQTGPTGPEGAGEDEGDGGDGD